MESMNVSWARRNREALVAGICLARERHLYVSVDNQFEKQLGRRRRITASSRTKIGQVLDADVRRAMALSSCTRRAGYPVPTRRCRPEQGVGRCTEQHLELVLRLALPIRR